jgi:hypothetical protein
MQERSDSSFFIQLVLSGKTERVESAKFVIGRVGDCVFDGSGAAGVGRLPQNTKERFRLAHSRRCVEVSKHRVLSQQGVCLCAASGERQRIFGMCD